MALNTIQELQEIAKEALKDHLTDSGAILYSSHETICPGEVYLMGTNPGGSADDVSDENLIGTHLRELPSRTINAYLDEDWGNGRPKYSPGQAPLQRRVVSLLRGLGFDPRSVLSTNLISMRSRNQRDISYKDAELCWPVHDVLLKIVQPRLIIAFGNGGFSAYGFLRDQYRGRERDAPSGHKKFFLKGFDATIAGNLVFVAGVPHLSRYEPQQRTIDWIRSRGKA